MTTNPRISAIDAAFLIGVGIVVVVCIAAAVTAARAEKDCRDRDGVVVKYNCAMIMQCTGVPQSSASQCYPVELCDWRCEARPTIDASGWRVIEAPIE